MTTDLPPLPHPYTPGSIRAAYSYRDYRYLWYGMLLSNIGTWMQNIALPAYVQHRTDSAGAVGVVVFAQLGPLLVLSIPGGVLASRVRRAPLLVSMQSLQLVFSLVLAWLVHRNASILALFLANLGVGIANALNAPAFQSTFPMLVDRRDLPGAVALNSTQLNGSRVVGPVIAALLGLLGVTVPQIFVINAATYLFVIAAILIIDMPPPTGSVGAHGWRELTAGLSIARRRPILGRLVLTMTAWSFLPLAYVGLFAHITERNLHIDPLNGSQYKWLYAVWGVGALAGGVAVGTVFAQADKRRLIAPGLVGFAVMLAVFAMLTNAAVAFPVVLVLGFFYFFTATAMITVFQQNMTNAERPFVMPLWFMSFGGTVPIGNLVFGPVMDRIGTRPVMLAGAVVSLYLARMCDLRRLQAGSDPLEPGDPAPLDEKRITTRE